MGSACESEPQERVGPQADAIGLGADARELDRAEELDRHATLVGGRGRSSVHWT